MLSALFLGLAADPAGSIVVFTMPPKNVMNLIHQAQG
jgi:hypothetical protein